MARQEQKQKPKPPKKDDEDSPEAIQKAIKDAKKAGSK